MTFFATRKRVNRVLRDCETRLAGFDLPVPADITVLTQYLSRRSGRLIHLMPMALNGPALSGLWLSLTAVDLVIYESETTRMHQEHIIAHELAHIICGHRSHAPIDEETTSRLFPSLDPALVRDMLNRADYSDAHELEAEVMASLVLRHLRTPQAADISGTPPENQAVLSRLERSFTLASSDGS